MEATISISAGECTPIFHRFFQNFLYISVFGIIGTIVTFVIILGLTYLINDNGIANLYCV